MWLHSHLSTALDTSSASETESVPSQSQPGKVESTGPGGDSEPAGSGGTLAHAPRRSLPSHHGKKMRMARCGHCRGCLRVQDCGSCVNCLDMSDSVQPQRGQPTRLPSPWDSPGKNTGGGCHFLLQCVKVKSESDPRGVRPRLEGYSLASRVPSEGGARGLGSCQSCSHEPSASQLLQSDS